MRENKGRIEFVYSVGQLVLLKNLPKRRKLDPEGLGPFQIVESLPLQNVVVIKRETGFMEKVNIRRVTPYTEPLVGQDVVSKDTHD